MILSYTLQGHAIGLSPQPGGPHFAISIQKEYGKRSKKTPDKNYGSHPKRRGGSREGTGTVPSLIINRFFRFYKN